MQLLQYLWFDGIIVRQARQNADKKGGELFHDKITHNAFWRG